jgi:heme o synthase
MRAAPITALRAPAAADLLALVKPRIMLMALLTAAGGLSLAPGAADAATWLALLCGTGLLVGAANTLNMYLERDVDCLMARTRKRPLPDGRMDPQVALVFGVAQAAVSVPILTFALNPLTGLLGVIALISYVNLYTPLKQRTTFATLVGSVPGAMPALMGHAAATGRIEAGGLAVFAVLFLWQMPHFHAIALFRHKEYSRAGLKTLPGERGAAITRRAIVAWLVVQLAASILPWQLGVAGDVYLAVAVLGGAVYLAWALRGLFPGAGPRWARQLFLVSIVYLPVLFAVLVFDGIA